MITYKFKIQNHINIDDYIRQFNNVIRFAYNRFQENKRLSLSDVEKIVKSKMNNIEILDASLIKVAVNKAKSIKKENIIFGGKHNFFRRIKNLITKEEWLEYKNKPLMLRGSSCDNKGNRKAELNIVEDNSILVKLNKTTHFNIQLPRLNKKQKLLLSRLQLLCENNKGCFSLELNNNFVYIIFDERLVREDVRRNIIKDRILSFDLNPNYVGLSVVDWLDDDKKIIHKEIIDIKNLNENKNRNKIKHEIMHVSKYIINLALHYRINILAFEKLEIKSSNKKKGKKFNKLVNNTWLRNPLLNNIKKRCNLENIKFQEIVPQYSSFIGQLTNPEEVDSVAASIELSRRANLFNKIYITEELEKQDIIYPKFNIGFLMNRWKKDLENNLNNIKSWLELYDLFKKSKTSYRFLFSLKDFKGISLRLFSVKSNVLAHKFI